MRGRAGILLLVLLGAGSVAGIEKSERKKMTDEIPVEVRDYLTAGDGLGQAAVIERYPDVRRRLESPDVRAAILRALAAGETSPGFTANALAYLQASASAAEAPVVRQLLTHPDAWVRVRACEYLLAVYYPAQDRASMHDLFETMLNDDDEIVRVQGARWVRDFKAAAEMRGVLQHWMQVAPDRKWEGTESFTILRGLLP